MTEKTQYESPMVISYFGNVVSISNLMVDGILRRLVLVGSECET